MRKLLYVFILFMLTCIDQISKYLAELNLVFNSKTWIIPDFFALYLTHNDGVAFSMLEGKQMLLRVITIAAIVLFVFLLRDADRNKKWVEAAAILLMFGGCIGNFIDRLAYSYVVDFFSFRFFGWDFAVFNVADIFITVGAFLYVIVLLKDSRNAKN